MYLVVIGVNNRTMPLDLFERVTVSEESLPKALADVAARANVSESVVLSTCNRTEVYVNAERFHGAFQDVRDFLAESAHMAPEDLSEHLYVHYDNEAMRHLCNVTCGLDSAVLGENEIQRQVKVAWDTARIEGAAGSFLNDVFRHALEVGKLVRTNTAISRSITSVSQAAVVMAAEYLGGLEDRHALVLGAGEMGEGIAASLAQTGLGSVTLVNRSLERAGELADRVGGSALPISQIAEAIDAADVMFTSTGATSLMLDQVELAEAMASRPGRPLLIVDIAVPRDVDPAAADIDGITLLDMNDLRAFADEGRRGREAELSKVHGLIAAEVERYLDQQSARAVAPLVASFRGSAEAVREAELRRFSSRLAHLSDADREAVEALTRGLLGKLLHAPTIRLTESAGSPRGDRLADALRELFDL